MRPLSNLTGIRAVERFESDTLPIADTLPIPERFSELRATVGRVNGRSELISRYHTSPLKIAKTFPMNLAGNPQLAVVQMDGSPGLLEGDRYVFDWRLEENTRLYVTNQAYTRVHPCGDGGYSKLQQKFVLEKGAILEWIPEPLMLFRGARFVTETEISLDERSICMVSDIFCPGRLSRGEAFDFQSYDAKVTVKHKDELIHYQRQKWEPAMLPITDAGCFGSFTHIGTFSVFSDRVTSDVIVKIRESLEALTGLPEGLTWGVARTARYGLVVQGAGSAAWKLQRLLLEAWDSVRHHLLEEPPIRLLKEAWMTGMNK